MKGNPMDWPARPDLEATIADLERRLHDAEAGYKRHLVKAGVWAGKAGLAQGKLTAAHARIAALEEALRESMAVAIRDGRASSQTLKKRLRDQDWYDKATRALLSPAPADAAHEEGTA